MCAVELNLLYFGKLVCVNNVYDSNKFLLVVTIILVSYSSIIRSYNVVAVFVFTIHWYMGRVAWILYYCGYITIYLEGILRLCNCINSTNVEDLYFKANVV